MTFKPSSPPASSRTSPLAPKSSAKPSFYRRVWPGRALVVVVQGAGNRTCKEASDTYLVWAWWQWL
jgi:hypothetical protein